MARTLFEVDSEVNRILARLEKLEGQVGKEEVVPQVDSANTTTTQ
jgi:hypothetical protein